MKMHHRIHENAPSVVSNSKMNKKFRNLCVSSRKLTFYAFHTISHRLAKKRIEFFWKFLCFYAFQTISHRWVDGIDKKLTKIMCTKKCT